MKSLVLFDLDGTLVDTIADLAAACNHALQFAGYPTHHVSAYQFYVGNGVTKLIERALPTDEATPETVNMVRAKFMEWYDLHCTDASVPYPGIPELLRSLQSRGIALAVTSNKYQAATEQIITKLFPDINWVAVEGQKAGVNIKPDPSVVFSVIGRHPVPKNEILMVGDSAVDMETARRACVESAGVTWGFRPQSELVEAGADHIIHNPSEILDLV